MNLSRGTELKVGLFTLVGLCIVVFGIMWGRQLSLGGTSQLLSIRFPASGGLIVGDPVTVNGVKLGRVEEVTVNGNDVIIKASLESGVVLRSDAVATIMMVELMGGKKIDIHPGVAATPLDLSKPLQGVTAEDIPGVVSQLGNLSGDLTRVLFRMDTLLGSMNSLMSDKQMVESVRHAIITLDATASMIKTFIARNEGDVETTLKNLKTLVIDIKDFFETNKPQFEKVLKGADRTLTNVDVTLSHADSALVSINGMIDEVKKGDGAAHKLVYDKDFGARLDSTIVNANRLINFILDHGVNVNLRLGTRP